MGAGAPAVYVDGLRMRVSLRHAEMLALLALFPGGLTTDRLGYHLYGNARSPVTIRAEFHRLRARLGADLVAARPYRLTGVVAADFIEIRDHLEAGHKDAAVSAYRGPLLPQSDSPTISETRAELHARVRAAARHCGDLTARVAFANRFPEFRQMPR